MGSLGRGELVARAGSLTSRLRRALASEGRRSWATKWMDFLVEKLTVPLVFPQQPTSLVRHAGQRREGRGQEMASA